MLTIQDVYGKASLCAEHVSAVAPESIATATTVGAMGGCYSGHGPSREGCNECWELYSFGVGKLADGRYVAIEESSDATGHGCQCSGSASIWPTLEQALTLGLSREYREAFAREYMEPTE